MKGWRLSDVARVTGGTLHGADGEFRAVSTDTRTLRTGDLFVALRGPRFDGLSFVEAARAAGACAALVSGPAESALPFIQVTDTRLALGQLARAWRERFAIPVIGVTGSNGKTTVKEMIAAILGQRAPVLVTQGNLNNDIGVPLTLLRLDETQRHAVIEMGANHAGEIDYLARLARPGVGLITNAGPAHLEGFGSLEGVARAKGELFAALGEDGVAVLNADDNFADLWRGLIGARRTVSFGMTRAADVTMAPGSLRLALETERGAMFTLRVNGAVFASLSPKENGLTGSPHPNPLPGGEGEPEKKLITLRLCGRHNVMNALAAAAAALAAGASLEDVQRGLASLRPVKGRLEMKRGPGRVRLIDDTYNANPGSVRMALEVLALAPGKKILAFGDMGELGATARALHAQMGEQARAAGVDALYAVGEMSRAAVESFGADGHHFASHGELSAALAARLAAPEWSAAVVLVKGSRSMGMERVVESIHSSHTPPLPPGEGWGEGRMIPVRSAGEDHE